MIQRPFALYVHVPFCAHKCPYCDFNTYATKQIPEREYVDALALEIKRFAEDQDFKGRTISTIFFGGGTPSLLAPVAICKVLDTARGFFPILANAEIAMEANPSGVSLETLRGYREAGVNRISFGAQSFSQDRLDFLGRDHRVSDIGDAVKFAREAGFENLSLDLIYGVPGQSVQELEADLVAATSLPIQHLSAYALTIEQGTPFYQRKERGLFSAAPEETVAQMMDLLPETLSTRGFHRYEISNFAKPGYESKHNCTYWSGDDYLGVGAGAHSLLTSYDGSQRVSALRWSTIATPERYISSAGTDAAISWREQLDHDALMFEFLYLGLRKTEGVSSQRFNELFGVALNQRYGKTVDELIDGGYLSVESDRLKLTSQGIKLADSVFERLLL